jgi:hypothetical protein
MIDNAVRQFVRKRAGDICEYCRLEESQSPLATLQVEHIIPRKHRGDDSMDNLALECIDCNLAKGPNIAGIDPLTGIMSRLFHPRQDAWDDHFVWRGIYLIGQTAIGRTTVDVLRMNSDDQLQLRTANARRH